MNTPESVLGKKMLAFERQQVKDGKREPLPIDFVKFKSKLSPRAKSVLQIIKQNGVAGSHDIVTHYHDRITVGQAARAITTLVNHNLIKKVGVQANKNFGSYYTYEAIDES